MLDAALAPRGRVFVVITMRSDFYSRVASFAKLNDVMSSHMMQAAAMSDEELREAIEQPAFLRGCEPEPGLTEVLLEEIRGQAGVLPLFEFTLDELWKRRQGRKLTHEAYRTLGGVKGALKQRADHVLAGLPTEQREIARRLFVDLVQLGEGSTDIKRRIPFDKFRGAHGAHGALLRQVLRQLQDERLITTSDDGQLYEVAHKALIREWPVLQEWLDTERAYEVIRRRLADAAAEWEEKRRDKGYLYSGARLASAREWAQTRGDELNPIEKAFFAASEEAERQRERDALETERRLRESAEARKRDAEAAAEWQRQLGVHFLVSAVVAGVLAVGLGGLALLANNARQVADFQRHVAETRKLVALSDAARSERLDVAMLLALEVVKQGDTLEARGSLQRSLDARPEVVRFLHVPEGDVTSVSFGPDGMVAAGYGVNGVRGGVVVFDARGERRRPAPLEVKEGPVRGLAFGPEGMIAVGYGAPGTVGAGAEFFSVGGVVLFDARGERLSPAPLEVKEGSVRSVAFCPEGRIAAGYIGGGAGVVHFDVRGKQSDPRH